MLRNDTAPPPFALLDEPLAYILAAHLRQRAVCAVLGGFATERAAGHAGADRITAYLTGDLRVHQEDEDLVLHPALRHRALPADGLDTIEGAEHQLDRQCEINVEMQIRRVAATPIFEGARARGVDQHLHGWIYGMHDGLLRDLGARVSPIAARDALPFD